MKKQPSLYLEESEKGGRNVNWKLKVMTIAGILTIIMTLLALYNVHRYYLWKDERIKYYSSLGIPEPDLKDFSATSFGENVRILCYSLVIVWMSAGFIILIRSRRCPRKALSLAVASGLLLSSLPFFSAPTVHAPICEINVDWTYDIYCKYDDYMGQVYDSISLMQNYFLSTFNIQFVFYENQFVVTDAGCGYDILSEAIEIRNWYWNKSYPIQDINTGEIIDYFYCQLLIVFVPVDRITDVYGISLCWKRALLVAVGNNVDEFQVLCHELGHQFLIGHCSESGCFMNVESCSNFVSNHYCDSCKSMIQKHANDFLKPPPPPPTYPVILEYGMNHNFFWAIIAMVDDDGNVWSVRFAKMSIPELYPWEKLS
jgi:hypothetical protein